jgi:squalene-associated FAD-dependent desaturase
MMNRTTTHPPGQLNRTTAHAPGQRGSVLVLGGGLAGLAAALRLGEQGFAVTVLESRQRLGGRAGSFTDPVSGQLIDACQHVSMGCCTAFAHFARATGIAHLIEPQPTLYFMTPDRRVSRFRADPLPAPLHLARAFLQLHTLSLAEKLRIAQGLRRLQATSPAELAADPPFVDWLARVGQPRRAVERFWGLVLVSALNETVERVGLRYAHQVFTEGFLGSRRAFEVHLPRVPLGRLYGAELQRAFDRLGVRVLLNHAVRRIELVGGAVQGVCLRDGQTLRADGYVAALPFARLLEVLPEQAVNEQPQFARLRHLRVAPITSVHVWYDRPITRLPHVVLVDCLGHWLFNRGELAAGEHYVQVVVSAARHLREQGHDQSQQQILAELARLFPGARQARVLRARTITETAATFCPVPGVDHDRPPQATPYRNLTLAGDYTRTGWPATMEGAVRSGYLAADALAHSLDHAQPLKQSAGVAEPPAVAGGLRR